MSTARKREGGFAKGFAGLGAILEDSVNVWVEDSIKSSQGIDMEVEILWGIDLEVDQL